MKNPILQPNRPEAAPFAYLVAPQKDTRTCDQLGVCLHPSHSCDRVCQKAQLMQPLGTAPTPNQRRQPLPAAPVAQPFGIDGPYQKRERMTPRDRRLLGFGLGMGLVLALGLVLAGAHALARWGVV